MRFDVYNDPTGWGTRVAGVLTTRGHRRDSYNPDVVFIRLLTFEPHRLNGLRMFQTWNYKGVPTLPGKYDCIMYDNKILQQRLLQEFMPESFFSFKHEDATAYLENPYLGYPVISKSSQGAQSRNVRIHYDKASLAKEVAQIFSAKGLTIEKSPPQKEYLLLQRFIPGNDGDLRVIFMAGYIMLLERSNRPDVPFASGSGNNTPVTELTQRHITALKTAREVVAKMESRMCAMDFVFEDGKPILIEVSCSWVDAAYNACRLFVDVDGEFVPSDTYKLGKCWPDILADEMERLACK